MYDVWNIIIYLKGEHDGAKWQKYRLLIQF